MNAQSESKIADKFEQAVQLELPPKQNKEELSEKDFIRIEREKWKQEKQKTRRMKQDLKLRKRYSKKIEILVISWMIFIAWILVSAGIKTVFLPFLPPLPLNYLSPFSLDNVVLIALISGTSINIIGLMMIVAKHLFPGGCKEKCKNYEE